MLNVLVFIVPFGLAGAFSPVMLTEQTVILAGPDGRRAAIQYAAGAMLTLFAFLSVLVLFGWSIALPTEPHLDATLDIVIGSALLSVALIVRQRRPRQAKPRAPRRAMSLPEALGFGVISMATNVTTLALLVPAAKEIAASDLRLAGRAVAVVVLVVLASIPAWVPPALTAIAPGPAAHGLRALEDLIASRGRALVQVALGGLGLVLIVRGIARLAGL